MPYMIAVSLEMSDEPFLLHVLIVFYEALLYILFSTISTFCIICSERIYKVLSY